MAARGRSINIDLAKYKPGLVFDADGITLLGKYTDELAAHRAKKRWVDVLGSYFLLERDRDYDLWVNGSLDDRCFVLSCSFVSACGRYAFWRLVNRQAPEAEDKLRGETPPDTFTSMWADIAKEEEKESWAADAIERQIADNDETRNLIAKIMRLFR
ncbi:MAG TPA: hypothetical protein PLP17_10730 [Oligoflexia bacterium]|nr:hypothetical protein [Oligoflexia bacterium]